MGYSVAAKNAMLNQLRTVAGFMSLHSADPGDSGTNEISGGSPAYARKAVTWTTAASGVINLNGTLPVFDVAAGTTVAHGGFWSASSGGTFYGSGPLPSPENFTSQGTYSVDSGVLDLNAL